MDIIAILRNQLYDVQCSFKDNIKNCEENAIWQNYQKKKRKH